MNNDLYSQPSNTVDIPSSISDSANPFGDFIRIATDGLLIFVGILVLTTVAFVGIRLIINQIRINRINKNKISTWGDSVILAISVPQETAEQSEKNSGRKKDETEVIGVGEHLIKVISEYAESGFGTWFNGGERFSLEIITYNQETYFWLVCREKFSEILSKQILAIYPKAHIEKVTEKNLFKQDMFIQVQELRLENRFELPFNTYKNMDNDPLNNITNSMTGLTKEEIATIQLVISPIKSKWQSKPRELASRIQQGQSPKQVLFPEKNFFKTISKAIFEGFKELFKPDKKDEVALKDKKREIDLTGEKQALNLTPQQQEFIKKLEEKSSKPGFHYTLRVVGISPDKSRADQIIRNIIPSFQIYDMKPLNWFTKYSTKSKSQIVDYLLRSQNYTNTQIINSEEVNTIWHLPSYKVTTPSIKWLLARRPPLPINLPEKGEDTILLGTASSRGVTKDVYIKNEDRFRHIYSLGGSGSGKSYLMTNVVIQDIQMGNGVCVVDPHGETIDDILEHIPPEREDDVIVFSPAITDRPLALNMLEFDPLKPTQKTLIIDTLFAIWDKLYNLKTTGGPMFEMYMKNSMRLVMTHPESGSTLMEISKVLTDEEFRGFKLAMCNEEEVLQFWEKEATKAGGEAALENMVPYITSKLAPFLTNDFIRPMIGQQKSSINFREAMDNKKIILVKLEKGLIGESSAYLVGMIIVGSLLMAGMGRNDGLKYNLDGTTSEIDKSQRSPFYVYIDEMQNFLFDAIPKALEEVRKYKVGFYLAHQFVKQVISQGDERIKDSIMANCASKFIYRAGPDDAQYLEKDFSPTLSLQDLMNPESFTCNAILLVNGQKTTPFNFRSSTWPGKADPDMRKRLMEKTKQKYGKPIKEIEEEIKNRSKLLF